MLGNLRIPLVILIDFLVASSDQQAYQACFGLLVTIPTKAQIGNLDLR